MKITEQLSGKDLDNLADVLSADIYFSTYAKKKHLWWSVGIVQLPLIIVYLLSALVNPEEDILIGYSFWTILGTIVAYKCYPSFMKGNFRKALKKKLTAKHKVPVDTVFEYQNGKLRQTTDEVAVEVPCHRIEKVEKRNELVLFYGASDLCVYFPQRGITEEQINSIKKVCANQ